MLLYENSLSFAIVFASLRKKLKEEKHLNDTDICKKRGFSLFGKELRREECWTVFWKAQNISSVSCFFTPFHTFRYFSI